MMIEKLKKDTYSLHKFKVEKNNDLYNRIHINNMKG